MIGVPRGDSVPWEAQPDARGRDPRRLRCLGSALSAAPMRRPVNHAASRAGASSRKIENRHALRQIRGSGARVLSFPRAAERSLTARCRESRDGFHVEVARLQFMTTGAL
jgi:hypothetical protein